MGITKTQLIFTFSLSSPSISFTFFLKLLILFFSKFYTLGFFGIVVVLKYSKFRENTKFRKILRNFHPTAFQSQWGKPVVVRLYLNQLSQNINPFLLYFFRIFSCLIFLISSVSCDLILPLLNFLIRAPPFINTFYHFTIIVQ
jgi:hypothetical protein